MKSIRYVVVLWMSLISISLFGQEASIDNKYIDYTKEEVPVKKKWPSTSCFSNWTPTFYGEGIPTDYKLYFSFDNNFLANNSILNQYLDKYMKIEYYWKNQTGVIPGYSDEYMLENPLSYYIFSNTNPFYFQCASHHNPPNGNPFFKLSFYEPDRNDPCGYSTLICSEEYPGGTSNAAPSNAVFYEADSYQCNISELCQYVDIFNATKSGDDLIISANNITNAVFNSVSNTSGFMIEIKGYNGAQTETRTIHGSGIPNFDIENWVENLEGFGNFSEYRLKLFYLNFDDNQYKSCGESRQLLFNSSSELCDILSLLKYSKDNNNTSLKWDFSDPSNPNYFSSQLADLGYTLAEAQILYSGITAIDFDLDYKENGIAKSLSIHHTVGQNNISDLNFTFNGLSFDDLEGKLKITYYFNIDGHEACQFIPFEFKAPQEGTGELKKYECGITYPQPTPDPSSLIELKVNDVVSVNGLTFKINTISGSGGTQPRSGTGTISLPFSKTNVLVTFSNITSDENYTMVSGVVQGVPGDPSNYPGFNVPPTPLNFGGDICLPEPPKENDEDDDGFDDVTGLNERGFDSNGIHENGTPYDDRGFDKDGKHKNGSPYDECGCDFEGNDKDHNPCKPCVNEKDVIEFIKDNKDKVNHAADSILQSVITDITSKLQKLDCRALNTKVKALAQSLKYPNDFVFGKDTSYIKPGLSTKFLKEPTQSIHKIEGKNPDTDSLEVNHIKLYHCDKLSIKYNEILTALDMPKEKLEEYINDKMKLLTLHQINSFKEDPAALTNWIKTILDELANEKGIGGTGSIQESKNEAFDLCLGRKKNQSISNYNATADIDEYRTFINENKNAEKIWMFNQGYTDIGGVNRENIWRNFIVKCKQP